MTRKLLAALALAAQVRRPRRASPIRRSSSGNPWHSPARQQLGLDMQLGLLSTSTR